MLAILAPGQGAQKPGMLTEWLELPGAESFFRWAGAFAGADLVELGTTGDAEAITDTAVTQPLVVAMSLFVARELGGLPGRTPHTPQTGRDVVIAGHSVGELTAAALAGVLSVEAAIALASVRGRAMAEACAQTPTGMSAVLGGDPDEVLAAIESRGLVPANRNGGGQVVAAGSTEALAALRADPPAKARVMPLPVAGAFHTPYMASAREHLEGLAGGLRPEDPSRLLLSNADGAAVDSGATALARLVSQVTSPVRFDACLDTMRGLGVSAVIELPPAGALVGLAKRHWKGTAGGDVEHLALTGPADLDRARELIAAERGRAEAEHLPDWRVVVSPVRGTVRPADVAEGTRLPAGTPLGCVSSRREEVNVSAGYDGVLAEWLVQDGDLVDAGDPLARLYPEESA
ncbi:acyltransferase domain-containing protein [Modestobacter sp. I12A-02628]|uniref:[acyl-carrier-protein] S-malonyltransferase n=1 Tax=Goekera deserti TaxID=2497753 RepID=A0A7K3WAW7_9ACTN|nr:acyltransferase domain-containing protein [Goekera deserti]MPQ97543.1 acyltransferase domain-containing protein [Goekera deserti]NDI47853.1 acyltransferase domain-containing protein [Goekera deserti]NEL53601.1 acyltransferase domain-containing protein [Goekera deserti]